MVSNSAKLYRRTKQHTQFGVSASNGSRDIARTKVAEKKKRKKMNVDNPIKHPLRGSLIMNQDSYSNQSKSIHNHNILPIITNEEAETINWEGWCLSLRMCKLYSHVTAFE